MIPQQAGLGAIAPPPISAAPPQVTQSKESAMGGSRAAAINSNVSMQTPTAIAMKYGNAKKIALAISQGILDPTQGWLAADMLNQIVAADVKPPEQTVFDKMFNPQQPQQNSLPVQTAAGGGLMGLPLAEDTFGYSGGGGVVAFRAGAEVNKEETKKRIKDEQKYTLGNVIYDSLHDEEGNTAPWLSSLERGGSRFLTAIPDAIYDTAEGGLNFAGYDNALPDFSLNDTLKSSMGIREAEVPPPVAEDEISSAAMADIRARQKANKEQRAHEAVVEAATAQNHKGGQAVAKGETLVAPVAPVASEGLGSLKDQLAEEYALRKEYTPPESEELTGYRDFLAGADARGEKDKSQALNMALLRGGASMMKGTPSTGSFGTDLLSSIGTGAEAALPDFSTDMKAVNADKAEAMKARGALALQEKGVDDAFRDKTIPGVKDRMVKQEEGRLNRKNQLDLGRIYRESPPDEQAYMNSWIRANKGQGLNDDQLRTGSYEALQKAKSLSSRDTSGTLSMAQEYKIDSDMRSLWASMVGVTSGTSVWKQQHDALKTKDEQEALYQEYKATMLSSMGGGGQKPVEKYGADALPVPVK